MKAFRILAILVGIFLLVGIVEDLLGLRMPQGFHLGPRLILYRDLVPAIAVVLLLMNPKRLHSSGQKFFYLATLFAVNLWFTIGNLQSFSLLFRSFMPPRVFARLALDWVTLAVLWGTFWVTSNQYLAVKKRKP